jgi:hypothetical protein
MRTFRRPQSRCPLQQHARPAGNRIQIKRSYSQLQATLARVHSSAAAAAAGAAGGGARGVSPQLAAQLQPPVLEQQAYVETWHGRQRRDEYHWLSGLGPSHPQVLPSTI